MNKEMVLGIDLGGTNIRAGLVKQDALSGIRSQSINPKRSEEEVLNEMFNFLDPIFNSSVRAIGIGVPGLVVDEMVYDVINIPSWKKIALKTLMEERYRVPVAINNDANCFALGEFYFGTGKGSSSMLGLTIGTGLGTGIILNGKLYSGTNGGAGEFGMIDYLDHCYEYYASGQFFQNVYDTNGETVFKNAAEGNADALKMYAEMGKHLGKCIKTILYAIDVDLIILGGSVSKAYSCFSESMWEQVKTFAFQKAVEKLRIEVSELQNSGVLGAAALCFDLPHSYHFK